MSRRSTGSTPNTAPRASDATTSRGIRAASASPKRAPHGGSRTARIALHQKDTPKGRYDARVARAEADFEVAKERCGDLAGHAREMCIAEARADEARAKDAARLDGGLRDADRLRGVTDGGAPMKRFAKTPLAQRGSWGYVLAWLLGVPIPILFLVYLLRGCT